jgi:hypothetical protein
VPPLPKDPKLRQRKNRDSTAAQLEAPAGLLEIPDLPARGRRKWHPFTVAWWTAVRTSPMATEYLEADLNGLYMLAVLVDEFWRLPSAQLAAEIRQQRQCFGLTPIDRRRLQWTVQRVEEGAKRQAAPSSRRRSSGDAREMLRVVS